MTQPTYRTRFATSPILVKVTDEGEEIIYGHNKYVPIRKMEEICKQLNMGVKLDFEEYEQ